MNIALLFCLFDTFAYMEFLVYDIYWFTGTCGHFCKTVVQHAFSQVYNDNNTK